MKWLALDVARAVDQTAADKKSAAVFFVLASQMRIRTGLGHEEILWCVYAR